MNQNLSVVILAAGLGTRMKSARAKVLHQAGGDTLLNQVIRAALHVANPDRIMVVTGHQADAVRASVTTPGVRFTFQEQQHGTGHAVLCARGAMPSVEGPVLILNGDGPLLKPETLSALTELHERQNAGGAIVTTRLANPTGYGRIIRDADGFVTAIVEEKAATPEQRVISEVNPGVYCFEGKYLWPLLDEIRPENPAKEYYVTDMVEILRRYGHPVRPLLVEDETELLGINTRVELAFADKLLRRRKAEELMLAGVTIENPETVTIDMQVEAGQDTIVQCNAQLRGATRIGANCTIGTGSVLRDCTVEDDVEILPYVVAECCIVRQGAFVGPFSRLRMNADAGAGSHIGNFVELKNTRMGTGAKASHLAYLGDATIGDKVNIGAGTITCNYDGQRKHQTHIAGNAFVGSNSTLVAPVEIGEGSYIAAGSVITKKVQTDSLAIGRAHQTEKPGWAKRRRELQKQS